MLLLLMLLLLALSSTNSRRRTFSAHYISEYINYMRGKKSVWAKLENSVSKSPEKSKYWSSVWCWGKRRRDFSCVPLELGHGGCVVAAWGTARCVLNWRRRILHSCTCSKALLCCCLRGYISVHTELAGIMRNDMHAKYQHVCLLFHSLLHHKPSNSKSHSRRNQVKPGFATILVKFY